MIDQDQITPLSSNERNEGSLGFKVMMGGGGRMVVR